MHHRRGFNIFFWSFVVLGFILLLGKSSPAIADLGNSDVTFAPSIEYSTGETSNACYIPGRQQWLCFQADTYSSDGQDVGTLFMQFPSDWWVSGSAPTVVTPSCTEGTFSGAVYWTGFGTGKQFALDHQRNQEPGAHCSAVYCVSFIPSETTTADILVPWSWYSSVTGEPPIRPCSSDGYYGFTNDPPCDQKIKPPMTIPICTHTDLTILPETLSVGEAKTNYSQQFTAEDPLG